MDFVARVDNRGERAGESLENAADYRHFRSL